MKSWQRLIVSSLLAAAGVLLARAILPIANRLFPKCLWEKATGKPCPACGGSKAITALANGDLTTAWTSNSLLCVGLIVGMWWFNRLLLKRPKSKGVLN